jgi:hypothetical protein
VFFWEYFGPLVTYALFYFFPRVFYPGYKCALHRRGACMRSSRKSACSCQETLQAYLTALQAFWTAWALQHGPRLMCVKRQWATLQVQSRRSCMLSGVLHWRSSCISTPNFLYPEGLSPGLSEDVGLRERSWCAERAERVGTAW